LVLVEETGGPRENHRPVASHWQILSHNVVHHALTEIRTHNISGDRHCLCPLFCYFDNFSMSDWTKWNIYMWYVAVAMVY
jgi:hypothetical protein